MWWVFTAFAEPSTPIQPLEPPTLPSVEVLTFDNQEVWWVDSHSAWQVIETCWTSDYLDGRWWTLEAGFREHIQTVDRLPLVSSDLDWQSDGFCIRVQGVGERVLSSIQVYEQTIQTFRPIKVSEPKQSLTLRDLHQDWLEGEHRLSKRVQRQLWSRFTQSFTVRSVIYSQQRPVAEITTVSSVGNVTTNLGKDRRAPSFDHSCMIQQANYPQVAVSIDTTWRGLTSPEQRLLNLILGNGVRSRLGNSLREELGLVYSIGSHFTGEAIRIEYTVDVSNLLSSLDAVEQVLSDIHQHGVTQSEINKARSMFLLRQYQILEDPASMVRIHGRFNSPQGWDQYLQQTLQAIDALRTQGLPMPQMQVLLTGPVEPFDFQGLPCQSIE